MRLLVRNLLNSDFLIFLRNNLNIKKIRFNLSNINQSASVSDSFCWRTDNNFETIFKFSDILSNFYKANNSKIKIVLYDKRGKFINKFELENLKSSNNKFEINKILLNGLEDYGTFHVYHKLNNDFDDKIIISNRCYVGYSKEKSCYSFMHGNTYSSYAGIAKDIKDYSNITLNKILTNSIYKIQNYFDGYDKSEFFFSNPTNKKIKFYLNDQYYELEKNACLLIGTNKVKIFTVKSNCLFLRPIVFNYKNIYIDVFHA